MNLRYVLPGLTIALISVSSTIAQQLTLPLWMRGAPEPASVQGVERDISRPTDPLVAGRKVMKLTDVSEPTLAVYQPAVKSGTAVLVFPGGGYRLLAYDLEGTEVCAWLNGIHVTCVLVKYRVPYEGHFPERPEDLEDAQQAIRMTREHAAEWGIDPKRVGVLGFSAGGHLAATLSNHFDFVAPGDFVRQYGGLNGSVSARPDFALVIYPGYLVHWPDGSALAPEIRPAATTPPTFLVQTEDDPVHEENALVYFQALKEAKVPAELHLYAKGGHGYGLRAADDPVTRWSALAETWLHTVHMLP